MTSVKAGTWVYDKTLQCLVPKHGRNYFDRDEKRSDLPFPMVIGGSMPTIKSMADGRFYDTKRNYEKSVHRHGCEIVGFDKNWQDHIKDPGTRNGRGPYLSDKAHEADIVGDVKRAIEEVGTRAPARAHHRRKRKAS